MKDLTTYRERDEIFPANAGTQGPRSSGWQPEGHRAATASAARGCFLFKTTRTSCRRKTRCAEVHSVAAATPRLLGLSLFYPSFSRRTPGPRDHGALGGSQKGIGPPRLPQHGGAFFLKPLGHRAGGKPAALRSAPWQRPHRGSWASRFSTPRFPGERRDPGTTEHWAAARRTSNHHDFRTTDGAVFSSAPKHPAGGWPVALRSAPWQRPHRGCWASRFSTPRFPGERRDPGTTEHWAAARRTSNHHDFRSTEGAVFS